jgi:hypothetical protein
MATAHSKEHKSDGVSVPPHQNTVDPLNSNGLDHADRAHVDTDLVTPLLASSHGHQDTEDQGQSANFFAKGKDVLSAEVGGVATAAVIGIGAALIEVELIPGLIIGAGAILLGKMFPQIGGYARPMLKGVVRAGLSASQKLREVMAEANEEVHDLVAEVKHEREQTQPVKQTHTAKDTEAVVTKPAH